VPQHDSAHQEPEHGHCNQYGIRTGKIACIHVIDGMKPAEINKMVGYATKNYQAENSKRYKKDLAEAIGNKDKAAAMKIKKDMEKHKLSKEEQKRILGKAFEEYQKSKKN
jgi:hypothetical protein